ncbi:MAG TPA: tetratricopeptide repeat protein [Terracidiphilus sp.]|nr:tetratricopeptide repeat protein [Terracidiphilus sp.]
MTGIVRRRVGRRQASVAAGVALIVLIHASAARAVNPDIPQVEARAERGSIQQQIQLAGAYFTGSGVEQNDRLAAYWYEKAANAGDPYAQKQIGFFYQAGIGVPRDPMRAVKWFERAAAGGLASARTNLGVAYVWGIGVPRDPEFGAQLFREALAKGDGSAGFSLGEMYYFGIGVAKDPVAAQHWYELGAKLHDPLAEFRTGLLILQHRPDTEGQKKAAELLRKSVLAGYVPAMHALGMLVFNHPDLAQSPSEMKTLLEDAEAAGTWQSSILLGIVARDGVGVPIDPAEAYYHFRVSVLQGGDEAAKLVANDLRTLAERIGPERAQARDAEASTWFQKHQSKLAFVYSKKDEKQGFAAFALTVPDTATHIGRLLPTPPL